MRVITDLPWIRPLDILIVVIAVGVGASVLLCGSGSNAADRLLVHHPRGVDTLSMDSDTAYSVDGAMGPVRVEIRTGRARIAESPCPGQDCVSRGWIMVDGQAAICAPSAVYLLAGEKGGSESTHSPDVISR